MRTSLRWVALALAAAACRDGVLPFSARDREPASETGPWRLTYSPGDDRRPTWSLDGDTIYYSAGAYDSLPESPGVLVAVHRQGGSARPLLQGIQVGIRQRAWLIAPAAAPAGERVAYIEMGALADEILCPGFPVTCDPPDTDPTLPPLLQATLRVRRFDALGAVDFDPAHSIEYAGLTADPTQLNTYEVRFYPYQHLFDDERIFPSGPSWAPDGSQLVFSDGLRLWIWTVGAGAAVIPNTEDGILPAWSPDGTRIAFTHVERADSLGAFCVHETGFNPCVEERTDYVVGARTLFWIRPDGSERTVLAPGQSPAWSAEGSLVFFRGEQDRVWRIRLDGSDLEPVPGAQGGHEPAPSPDGRFLAFTRRTPSGTFDVWVISLEPAP